MIPLKLGYELEAGFCQNEQNKNVFSNGLLALQQELKFKIGSDGSVSLIDYEKGIPAEIKSVVYSINKKKDLKKVIEEFKKISEEISEVNKTCGLHFHISFKDIANYYILCCYDFVNKFKEEYEKRFKTLEEKERINNQYCKAYADIDEFKKYVKTQLGNNSKNYARYKLVNYNSFNFFKTIEFRVFKSVNNPKKFKEYLYFLVDFINDYIHKHESIKKKEILAKKSARDKKEDTIKEIKKEDIINNKKENMQLNYSVMYNERGGRIDEEDNEENEDDYNATYIDNDGLRRCAGCSELLENCEC